MCGPCGRAWLHAYLCPARATQSGIAAADLILQLLLLGRGRAPAAGGRGCRYAHVRLPPTTLSLRSTNHARSACLPARLLSNQAAEDKDNAALYIHFMKKAVAKGGDYIGGEAARLAKMAEKAMSGGWLDGWVPLRGSLCVCTRWVADGCGGQGR